MRYKVKYTIPFDPNPEIRDQVFEREIEASDSQTARRILYVEHPNASVQELEPIRHSR